MIILGLILGYIIRLAYFIFDLVIRFITGFIKGIYFLIAEGENPFKFYWHPFVGFLKFASVVTISIVIWNCCMDFKENQEEYKQIKEEKIEYIKSKLHIDRQKETKTIDLKETIAETVNH